MSHALFRPVAGRADEIIDFIMHTEEVSAHPSVEYAIHLACEEIIANITSYAYPAGVDGYIGLDVTDDGKELRIEIRDGGRPFNPVEKETPDVTQSLDSRDIGGLGIYLVLQMMDQVSYSYEEGKNKLVLVKNINKKGSHD